MGLFKKIAKGIGGIFKKKKKGGSAPAAAVAAAIGPQIPDYIASSFNGTKPNEKKKGGFWGFLTNGLESLSNVTNTIVNGPKEPLDLNKYVKLPTMQIEASKQQNTNFILIGGAALLLFLFTRKKSS